MRLSWTTGLTLTAWLRSTRDQRWRHRMPAWPAPPRHPTTKVGLARNSPASAQAAQCWDVHSSGKKVVLKPRRERPSVHPGRPDHPTPEGHSIRILRNSNHPRATPHTHTRLTIALAPASRRRTRAMGRHDNTLRRLRLGCIDPATEGLTSPVRSMTSLGSCASVPSANCFSPAVRSHGTGYQGAKHLVAARRAHMRACEAESLLTHTHTHTT